ncbi:hypothetical protein Tco_0665619 [Tanacetum coccineum]
MNDEVHDPNPQNSSPSEIKEPYKPSPRIDSYKQPSCLGSTFVSETLRRSDQMHQLFKKSSLAMTRDKMEDKMDNPSPQSTLQFVLSFEEYTDGLFPSFREFSSVEEPEPQPLPNFPSLGVNLRYKRGPKPPIKPHNLGSFRMKEIFDEKTLSLHVTPKPNYEDSLD